MKVINLNEDPYCDGVGDCKILVTKYETGSYDGSGDALALTNDNAVRYYSLGHCSCYGPFDGYDFEMTLEQFFDRLSSATTEWPDEVEKAFLEALKEEGVNVPAGK